MKPAVQREANHKKILVFEPLREGGDNTPPPTTKIDGGKMWTIRAYLRVGIQPPRTICCVFPKQFLQNYEFSVRFYFFGILVKISDSIKNKTTIHSFFYLRTNTEHKLIDRMIVLFTNIEWTERFS